MSLLYKNILSPIHSSFDGYNNIIKLENKKENNYQNNNKNVISNNYLFNKISFFDENNLIQSLCTNDFFTNNENTFDVKMDNCKMGKKCPYLKKYIILQKELKGLITSINKIKKLNDLLSNSLEKKSKLYQVLIDENEHLKKEYYKLTQKKYYNDFVKKEKSDIIEFHLKTKRTNSEFFKKQKKPIINLKLKNNGNRDTKFKNILFNSIFNDRNESKKNNLPNFKNNAMNTINYSLVSPKKQKNLINDLAKSNNNIINKNPSIQNIRNNDLVNINRPEIHYDLIDKYTKTQKPKFISDKMKRSFLSYKTDYEVLIKNNNALNKLTYLTKSEENYLSIIKTSSDEILLKYFDMINLLISDYKDMLKLGIRMKDFIKNSITLVESIIDNNSIKVLIENTCTVLNCDRASLFILDKISDSLIVYSGEGIRKAQIKVPKDAGIVGACFMDMKKIRIDDAYLDVRFNKEIDKLTNYRTKSLLCYPLVDNHGECFGVIEAINKMEPPFNIDDEELIRLLANQASIIFRSLNSYDDNRNLTIKMMKIVNYNINIYDIKDKAEFTEKTEDFLLNIFDCLNSRFYFVENNKIIRYTKKERSEYDINIGIIGKVIKLRDILGYQNIKNSVDYNSIIDINSYDGILTFPILEIKTKIIKGVVQVPYIGKIYKNGKPKDSEVNLIKKLRKCIKYWIKKNGF